jgi:hypothetical protein
LVKPVNTPDLLRQIEALLVTHEDAKAQNHKVPEPKTAPQGKPARSNAARKAV